MNADDRPATIGDLRRALEAMRDWQALRTSLDSAQMGDVDAALATLPAPEPSADDWPVEPEQNGYFDAGRFGHYYPAEQYDAMRDHARATRRHAEQRIARARDEALAEAEAVAEELSGIEERMMLALSDAETIERHRRCSDTAKDIRDAIAALRKEVGR